MNPWLGLVTTPHFEQCGHPRTKDNITRVRNVYKGRMSISERCAECNRRRVQDYRDKKR